ncbi:MAG: hypothetical protein J5835_07660 [Bacteroidales bacterium]|nr:hypothetical protein [Bacteroidales bacterium]
MNEQTINDELKKLYERLSNEQKQKADECKTADEFLKLMGELGIELPDGLADVVTGGTSTGWGNRTPQQVTGRGNTFR